MSENVKEDVGKIIVKRCDERILQEIYQNMGKDTGVKRQFYLSKAAEYYITSKVNMPFSTVDPLTENNQDNSVDGL